MLRFNNDYNQGAHPTILAKLAETNDQSFAGYGLDEVCDKAAELIKEKIGDKNAAVHFLIGGTQTNYTFLASALRPFQGIVCADSAHINVHETGAVENTGHKLLVCPGFNGKLSAKELAKQAELYRVSVVKEHITQPKLVFLSFPSEFGTIYSKQELLDIKAVCKEYNMYLYIDGARLGYGLAAEGNDVSLADLAQLADAFYIGGTKCGALFGEALVIINDDLKDNFRAYMKQNGALLAKGWLLGLQFMTLFTEDLYFKIAKEAVENAMLIKAACIKKHIPFVMESNTNQQFVIVTKDQMDTLAKNFVFDYEGQIDEEHHAIRFCTSWSTRREATKQLVTAIEAL